MRLSSFARVSAFTLVLSACASSLDRAAETVAVAPAEITLNLIGSGGAIWAACPGCAAPTQTPLLRPLRNATRGGTTLWTLSDEYMYVFENTCEAIVVPKNFVTDLASIPRAGRVLYNPANYAEAALVHDWIYAVGATGERGKADLVFREALTETGHAGVAGQLYAFVNAGGEGGYGHAEDYSFWDAGAQKVVRGARKPPSGFMSIDQLVDGGSETVAQNFGLRSGGTSADDVKRYLRSLCTPRGRR